MKIEQNDVKKIYTECMGFDCYITTVIFADSQGFAESWNNESAVTCLLGNPENKR